MAEDNGLSATPDSTESVKEVVAKVAAKAVREDKPKAKHGHVNWDNPDYAPHKRQSVGKDPSGRENLKLLK